MLDPETKAAIDELWELFRETDARFKETDARFKETDARFKETDAQIKESDTRIKELFRETDAKFKETQALFIGQWGRMMEALVEPGALQVFKDRGFDVHQIFPRAKGRQNGSIMEIDLLLTNTDELVFVEVKSTLRVADVDEALEDLAEFPRFFPTYADYRIYGAVAGLTIEENADRYAYKNGLFVIAVTGDNMVEILNDAK